MTNTTQDRCENNAMITKKTICYFSGPRPQPEQYSRPYEFSRTKYFQRLSNLLEDNDDCVVLFWNDTDDEVLADFYPSDFLDENSEQLLSEKLLCILRGEKDPEVMILPMPPAPSWRRPLDQK
jgi:hypothetical protein